MNEQVLDHCARVYVRGGPEIMASPGLAVPEEPHQPLSFYKFSKRQYGQKKPVFCSFKGHWFTQWPFLHYNQAECRKVQK